MTRITHDDDDNIIYLEDEIVDKAQAPVID